MTQHRTPNGTDTLERTRYFSRQIVAPPDLAQDREYLLHKLRHHNRLLHGWGIVSGLEVKAVPPIGVDDATKKTFKDFADKYEMPTTLDTTLNSWVVITPGYAITPRGDEIYIPNTIFVNTNEERDNALVTRPSECNPQLGPRTITRKDLDYYLVVEAVESEARPVRAAGSRCGDNPDQFEFSRLRDGVRFTLVEKRPPEPFLQNGNPNGVIKLTGNVGVGSDCIVLGMLSYKSGKIEKVSQTKTTASSWIKSEPVELPA